MVEVRSFSGVRYSPAVVEDVGGVICPPYDVVSASQETSLLERSPYNAVRLELREVPSDQVSSDRYDKAGATFRDWLDQRVLVPEPSRSMYLVEETFTHEGEPRSRLGLMAAVRLVDFSEGAILPHEFTRPGPKADRLALMKAARCNFSPIMSLYDDSDGDVAGWLAETRRRPPALVAAPDGQPQYRMWVEDRRERLSALSELFASKQLFVADGHHRYETAIRYRDDLEASEGPLPDGAAARYALMMLVSMDDPGLLVLPYHRLIGGLAAHELEAVRRRLNDAFRIDEISSTDSSPAGMVRAIEGLLARQPAGELVVATLGLEEGRAHLLTLRESLKPGRDAPPLERCEPWLLHERGIARALDEDRQLTSVSYTHDAAEAASSVMAGAGQIAFFLRAIPMPLFAEVVGMGERLPPKSTYFFPKAHAGLVFNRLEGEL